MHFEEITFNPSRSTHPKIQRLTPPTHTPLADGNSECLDVGAACSPSPGPAWSCCPYGSTCHMVLVIFVWPFFVVFFWFG